MKKILLLFIYLPFSGFSQDNIILNDGIEISFKIIEINTDNIKYKNTKSIWSSTLKILMIFL